MIIFYNDILDKNLWWKIYNLIKIKDYFNIPAWFVITEISDLNWKNIYEIYKNNILTDFYICRSSMNNEDSLKLSYAWLFDSIEWKINENILEKDINEVFSSLNNDFLDNYELNIIWKKVNDRKMNVLIQEFIIWDISWIYFSKFNWKKLIEYVKWCNQFLVNATVKSNKIILDDDYNILEHIKNIQYKYIWENLDIFIYNNENNSLSFELQKKLINELQRLRSFFDYEIDVEWTIKNWLIYILQVRPITK